MKASVASAFIPTGLGVTSFNQFTTKPNQLITHTTNYIPPSKRVRVVPASMNLTETTIHLAVSTPALEVGKFLAGPCINLFNFVMIIRIILSWYPKTDLAKAPWIFIAVPTEPLLKATRKVIQPVGGVDISPIVWFAVMSFVHEILVGKQGLLILLSQK